MKREKGQLLTKYTSYRLRPRASTPTTNLVLLQTFQQGLRLRTKLPDANLHKGGEKRRSISMGQEKREPCVGQIRYIGAARTLTWPSPPPLTKRSPSFVVAIAVTP